MRPQRSSARRSARTSESGRFPETGGNGFSFRRSPRAAVARPSATIWSRTLRPWSGTIRATGRPRSVTSIVSPSITRRIRTLAFWRNSRIPALIMDYIVAHDVLLARPQALFRRRTMRHREVDNDCQIPVDWRVHVGSLGEDDRESGRPCGGGHQDRPGRGGQTRIVLLELR